MRMCTWMLVSNTDGTIAAHVGTFCVQIVPRGWLTYRAPRSSPCPRACVSIAPAKQPRSNASIPPTNAEWREYTYVYSTFEFEFEFEFNSISIRVMDRPDSCYT